MARATVGRRDAGLRSLRGLRRVPLVTLALVLAPVFACSEEEVADPSAPGAGATGSGPGTTGGSDAPSAPMTLPPYVAEEGPLPPDYSIFDHGKECFDRFQVAVPAFDCDGPDASRLKIEVSGTEVTSYAPSECDKPSLVGTKYACVPGARITKFEQRNKFGHRIATVVACRRSKASALDSGLFDNIAVLQGDLENNEVCWYQIRESSGFVGRNVPAPYAPGRTRSDANDQRARALYVSPVELTTDGTECTRCHDGSVWLRTPWIGTANQVPSPSGKVHEIPRTTGTPTFVGRAYRAWNQPANRPKQIKIQNGAFDAAHPPTATERAAIQSGAMAPSDACTQCHSVGKSLLATSGQGSCNHFARYFMANKPSAFSGTVLGSKVSPFGDSFPRNAWMPPSAGQSFASDAAYQAFYARAFKALELCCDDPSRAGCGP